MVRVFESSLDSLNNIRFDVGRGVIEMEVFIISFIYNLGVVFVDVEVLGNVFLEFLEYVGGISEVEISKFFVINILFDNFRGVFRDELNNGRRKIGFKEDFMNNVIGVGGYRRGFLDIDVVDNDRSVNEVIIDSSEVEGGDGKDEIFERLVFNLVKFIISFKVF